MYVEEFHKDVPGSDKVAENFINLGHRKLIQKTINEILDSEYDALVDYAETTIVEAAASRATDYVLRLLKGDPDAISSLVKSSSGRYKKPDEPWAKVIHGKIFETDAMTLHRQIVEANADILKNERILDLESTVEGLRKQLAGMQADRSRLW